MEDPEQPLGHHQHHLLRKEFQTDVGNFYHCHLLWWNDDGVRLVDQSARMAAFTRALSRVTATIPGPFRAVVPETNEFFWVARARDALTHKCQAKCMVPDSSGVESCR